MTAFIIKSKECDKNLSKRISIIKQAEKHQFFSSERYPDLYFYLSFIIAVNLIQA
jgi:hypothetical protein